MRARSSCLILAACFILAGVGPALAADGVPGRLDAARQAYQKGDLSRTARELEGALTEIYDRLGRALAETMPPVPPGWEADAAEIQGLGQVGGGLSVSRAYVKDEASLNASLIIDSPAVAAAAALIGNPAAAAAQPNLKKVKIGAEDALLRWDQANRSGEITMVLGGRVLLEVQGDALSGGDSLTEMAKGWNLAQIRKLAGL